MQPLDGLPVQRLCFLIGREQGAAPGLNSKGPVRSARIGAFHQALEGRSCLVRPARAAAGFDQLDRRPLRIPEVAGVLERLARGAEGVFVPPQSIAEYGQRPGGTASANPSPRASESLVVASTSRRALPSSPLK